jgi:hypothetical protein
MPNLGLPKAGASFRTETAPWFVLLSMLVLLSSAGAADQGAKAEFIGGTLPAPSKSSMRVDLTSAEALVFRLDKSEIRIPYQKINAIEYGQKVSRRYAEAVLISPMLLLSKSRKHYVTLGYVDERQARQAVVFRVDKGDIRAVLAGLEARTGRRVEYQDDQARKGVN